MPNPIRAAFTALIILTALLLTSCVEVPKYPTIEPVSFRPSAVAARSAVTVDSLRPTFSWKTTEPGGGVADSYDFGIWEVLSDGSAGEMVQQKQGIFGTSYLLEKPLLPNHEYYWSVKKSNSSVWATISFVGVSPLGADWGHGQPFKIRTPGQ